MILFRDDEYQTAVLVAWLRLAVRLNSPLTVKCLSGAILSIMFSKCT